MSKSYHPKVLLVLSGGLLQKHLLLKSLLIDVFDADLFACYHNMINIITMSKHLKSLNLNRYPSEQTLGSIFIFLSMMEL